MQYFEDLELGAIERFGSYPVTREEVIQVLPAFTAGSIIAIRSAR